MKKSTIWKFSAFLVLVPAILGFDCSAQTGGDALIYPNNFVGKRITHFFFDVKNAAEKVNSTTIANDLYVTDDMNGIRIPIYGDAKNPCHPEPGVVNESGYESILTSIEFAKAARGDKDFFVFASKKLEGETSFPDWTKDANGVVAGEYVKLLTDYLIFMKSKGVEIDYLGIQNEEEYNEGNITPAKHKDIVDGLRLATELHGIKMPQIVGWEGYGPNKNNWMKTMHDNGWLDRMDIYGVHYYPQHRPWSGLMSDLNYAGEMPFWATEPHWDNKAEIDDWDEAEKGICTLWDQAEAGMSGFMWWAYARSGSLRGNLMREFSVPLKDAVMIDMDDIDGRGTRTYGRLQTRAFREGNTITVYAVNNHATTGYPDYGFTINTGSILGEVTYRQWIKGNGDNGEPGTLTPVSNNRFELSLPAQSITSMTFNLATTEGIAISTNQLEFGMVDNDASPKEQTIYVSAGNIGGDITMSITGADASSFGILGTSVIDANQDIANRAVAIRFTPSKEGNYQAILGLRAGAYQVEAALSATVYSLSPIAMPFIEPFPDLVALPGPIAFEEVNTFAYYKGWEIHNGQSSGTDRINIGSTPSDEGFIQTPKIELSGAFEVKFFTRMLLNNIGATNAEKAENNKFRNMYAVLGQDTIYDHKKTGSTLYQNFNEWTCTYVYDGIEKIKFVSQVSDQGVWAGKNDGFSFGPRDASIRVQPTTLPAVNIAYGHTIDLGGVKYGTQQSLSFPLKGFNLTQALNLTLQEGSKLTLPQEGFAPDAAGKVDAMVVIDVDARNVAPGVYTEKIILSGETPSIQNRTIWVSYEVYQTTGLDTITAQNFRVFQKEGHIYVETTKSGLVQIYSTSGMMVTERFVREQSSFKVNRGIYIVKMGRLTKKVVVID